MIGSKLGIRWTIEAAHNSTVPLKVAVIAPTDRWIGDLLARQDGYFDQLTELSKACGFSTMDDICQISLASGRTNVKFNSGSIIQFHRGTNSNTLRGYHFQYIWANGARQYTDLEYENMVENILFTLDPTSSPDENVLITA